MLVKYIARRLFASVIVVRGVPLIALVLMARTRGSYVPGLDLNPALRPEDIARLRADLGLDQPLQPVEREQAVQHARLARADPLDGRRVLDPVEDVTVQHPRGRGERLSAEEPLGDALLCLRHGGVHRAGLVRALPDALVEHGTHGDDVCLLGFRFSGRG